MNRFAVVAFALVCMVPDGAGAQAVAEPAKPPAGVWPKMIMQQGRYFSYPRPAGWTHNESTNGIDVIDSLERSGYNFVGLEGTPGSTTPRQHVEWVVRMARGSNFRLVSTTNRPTQNGFETAEFIFTFVNYKGLPMTAWAWSAVNNSFGRNNTYCEIAFATNDLWADHQQFLVAAARLVQITNVQQAFRRDELIRMGTPSGPGSSGGFNHPNTFTPYSDQAAKDRMSAQRSVTIRGVTPLVDPSTGQTYRGTWDNYDHVKGGWVNPQDPTQLLKVVRPPD